MTRKTKLFEFEWERCPDGYIVKHDVITNPTHEELTQEHEKKCQKRVGSFPAVGYIPPAPTEMDFRPRKKLIRHIYPKSDKREKYILNFTDERIINKLMNITDSFTILNFEKVRDFADEYGLIFDRKVNPYEDMNEWDHVVNVIQETLRLHNQPKGHLKAYEYFNNVIGNMLLKPYITGDDSPTRHYLSFRPHNLCSVIYLQLINKLTAGVDLVPCQAPKCTNMFPYTRKDKKTCQESCKKRLARYNNSFRLQSSSDQ